MLGARGTCPFNAGLESPEQIGKADRHGGTWRIPTTRAVHVEKLAGGDHMDMFASCNNPVDNDGMRKQGYAHRVNGYFDSSNFL